MKAQRGMSLVELVVALAVSGIIIAFLGTAVYQIVTVSGYGVDRLTTTHELENIAHWLHTDVAAAREATGGETLVLMMADNTTITYMVTGKEMLRTAGSSQLVLARNITATRFTADERMVSAYIAASPPGRYAVSQNSTYYVYLRPTRAGQ